MTSPFEKRLGASQHKSRPVDGHALSAAVVPVGVPAMITDLVLTA
jgi:hypothetical protein